LNIKRTAALLAAAAIAALATTATAAAATPAPPGIEHWTAENTNPVSATAVLIARGPLTAGGTINLQTGHVTLPGGTVTLSHRQSWGTQGENPHTCLATLRSSGTYTITGGTGRYTRLHGHGTYSLTAYAIVHKVNGTCATGVVPYAQTELLTAAGPLIP
jgi:hypothetical protein